METFAKSIKINGKQARYYDLSDLNNSSATPSQPSAHFYGGNGFTVGNYTPLLTELAADFELSALAMRGYWYDKPTKRTLTREQDASVLIEFLERTQDGPVIGIGHSQGATATAMAAAKRPDLFSQLFLIEPVTFTKKQALLYKAIPRRVKLNREPFKSALSKPLTWSSTIAFYEHLRAKRAYRRISDEHLQIFAKESLTRHDDGSYRYIFSPKRELASYFGIPFIDSALKKLNKTQVPYTLIIGKPTIFISDKVRKNWQQFVPAERIITLNEYGHLLPIEAPKECANLILTRHASFTKEHA